MAQSTRQQLAVGPKSHSQLWDPRLERATGTAMRKDQEMLERALAEISYWRQGEGHAPARYHLKEAEWSRVDAYFHLFSWSAALNLRPLKGSLNSGEQQKVEENLISALKALRYKIQCSRIGRVSISSGCLGCDDIIVCYMTI